MMGSIVVAAVAVVQAPAPWTAIDVSSLLVAKPTVVVEIDTGKVKGEPRRLRVPNTRDAVLPAWSSDGVHLAWFQRSAKKKYTLHYAWVSKG